MANSLPVPVPVQEQAPVEDNAEQSSGGRAIAIGKRFVEALEALEVAELTANLRGDLARTLDDVSGWQAKHDGMLKLLGQL